MYKRAIQSRSPALDRVYCPICALKNPQALRIVAQGSRNLAEPFDILANLKASGFVPLDIKNYPITTPNKWRDALHLHLQGCLGQDFALYEKGWQSRQRDQELHSELRERVASFGGSDDPDLQLKMRVLDAIGNDASKILHLRPGQRLTQKQVLELFRDYLPTILFQQLKIVSMAQQDYLNGFSAEAPLAEFASIKKTLEVLGMVVGEFGISDAIDPG
jgi:hypothetical protein